MQTMNKIFTSKITRIVFTGSTIIFLIAILFSLSFFKKENIASPLASGNLRMKQILSAAPKNTFRLKKTPTFIPKAHAATVIDAASYIVVDQETGEILEEKDSAGAFPIASLTKIMSAVITLDATS